MFFSVICKFNTELVKNDEVAVQEIVSNISFLSTPGQVTPKQTHLTVYAYPGYQYVSLAS